MGHLLELPVLLVEYFTAVQNFVNVSTAQVGSNRHGNPFASPTLRLDQGVSSGLHTWGEEKATATFFSSKRCPRKGDVVKTRPTSTQSRDTSPTTRASTSTTKLRARPPTRCRAPLEGGHAAKPTPLHGPRVFPLPPLQSPPLQPSPHALYGLLHPLTHRHSCLLQHATTSLAHELGYCQGVAS